MLCGWLFIAGSTITGEKHTFFFYDLSTICAVLIFSEFWSLWNPLPRRPLERQIVGIDLHFKSHHLNAFNGESCKPFTLYHQLLFTPFLSKYPGDMRNFFSLNVNLLIDWAETKIKCRWDKEYIVMIEFESFHFCFWSSRFFFFVLFFLLIFIDSSSSECCVANRMINERQTWPTLPPQTFFSQCLTKSVLILWNIHGIQGIQGLFNYCFMTPALHWPNILKLD